VEIRAALIAARPKVAREAHEVVLRFVHVAQRRPTRDRYASPASVRLTLRVVRFSNLTPSRVSKWRIAWLSAEGRTRALPRRR